MGAMLPAHWHGPNTDFALLHTVSSALHQLASQPFAPRVDSVIEIARQGLAQDYIAGLKRLSEAFHARGGRGLCLCSKCKVSETFQVEGRDQVPLRNLAHQAQGWRDSQSRFDEWRRLLLPTRAFGLNTRLQSPTGWRQGGCRPLPSNPCSTALSQRPSGLRLSRPCLSSVNSMVRRTTRSPASFGNWRLGADSTTVQIVRARHAEKIPRGNYGAMSVIRSEIQTPTRSYADA